MVLLLLVDRGIAGSGGCSSSSSSEDIILHLSLQQGVFQTRVIFVEGRRVGFQNGKLRFDRLDVLLFAGAEGALTMRLSRQLATQAKQSL
jgi:hypothetical protein